MSSVFAEISTHANACWFRGFLYNFTVIYDKYTRNLRLRVMWISNKNLKSSQHEPYAAGTDLHAGAACEAPSDEKLDTNI